MWYKCTDSNRANSLAITSATEATYVVETTKACSDFYYAVVGGVASKAVKVSVYNVVNNPIVFRFNDEAMGTYLRDVTALNLL